MKFVNTHLYVPTKHVNAGVVVCSQRVPNKSVYRTEPPAGDHDCASIQRNDQLLTVKRSGHRPREIRISRRE
jgi:hypothetical protein